MKPPSLWVCICLCSLALTAPSHAAKHWDGLYSRPRAHPLSSAHMKQKRLTTVSSKSMNGKFLKPKTGANPKGRWAK